MLVERHRLWGTLAGRTALIVPLILVGLWFSVRITTATVLARVAPELAIQLDGANSQALERAATLAAAGGTRADARRGQALARQALASSPMSAEGAAAIGTTRALLDPRAEPVSAFEYSQMLSRRIALTQIWMIEHWVGKGNIPAALRAYDRLFRTNDTYRGKFMPVLLRASAEPAIAQDMAQLLAEGPPWSGDYFGGLLANFPGPENFMTLVGAMRFDPVDPEQAKRLSLALGRLIESGRPELAQLLYQKANGLTTGLPIIRGGDFTRLGSLPPIDWELANGEQLQAQTGVNEAGHTALYLVNNGGQVGAFARQLLFLRQGRYRLTYAVGGIAGEKIDRPKMKIQCFNGRALTEQAFPAAPGSSRTSALEFNVPGANCLAQWLIIEAGQALDALTGEQWVTDLQLKRIL